MTSEADIARALYEEVWESTREKKSVRLALRIPEVQRRWPNASESQIIRAYLIVYELLVQDVAEAIHKEKPRALPLPKNGYDFLN